MPSQLFTECFLTDGIRTTAEWRECLDQPEVFAAFRESLAAKIHQCNEFGSPNEDDTQQDLVRPVLDLLGWTDSLPQQGSDRNEDIPGYLLFADADYRVQAAARSNSQDRYLYGLSKAEVAYVLETFPIVRREDKAAFDSYRTKDLILAYMNALEAGDPETMVAM